MVRMLADGGRGRSVRPAPPKNPRKPADAQRYQAPSTAKTQPINRGGYSVAQKDTGLPMNQHIQTYGSTATPQGFSGGGGMNVGGFGGGGGGMGMEAMSAPAVTPPSEEDYLAGDSGYQTQLSALQGALKRYLADSDFQRSNYTTDYNRSLRDLGYDEGSKQWNWNDRLTASGRGYNNQLDDFASRGMLQSQGYADAYNELVRMLGQQYDALSGAKNTFMTDMDNQIANFKGENTSNIQAARAEALQRRAAQYAL